MVPQKYKVFVRCITYNHAPYIIEALDGFVCQKTKFPVVTAIIDDDSQDGNKEKISDYFESNFDTKEEEVASTVDSEYALVRFARHKKNINCFFVIVLLKVNHQSAHMDKLSYVSQWRDNSEYFVLCEGDDYWSNPNKLQMQVDFMDRNPDYSMCCTDYNLADGSWKNHNVSFPKDGVCFPYSILHELPVCTTTALFRKKHYDQIPKSWIGKGWKMSDTPMWIELSTVGKIKFIPKVTSNYRLLVNSASHGDIDKEMSFADSAVEIHQYYANKYGIDLPNNGYDKGYYLSIMRIAFKHKHRGKANSCFKKAMFNGGLSIKLLVFYLGVIIPPLGCFIRRKIAN